MNAFERSWSLLKSSLSIIARNKQLLVFPFVTFVCTAAILFFFLGPPLFRPTGYSYVSAQHWQAIGHSLFEKAPSGNGGQLVLTPGATIYLAFMYLISMFLATFFNVGFYHEILAALGGQSVSIGRGLKFACTKLKAILVWTLFAGLVGLLIKFIEERMALVGRIVGRLIGIAWSVAAVFAIPVIVREEQSANPVAVLKRSATVLKRTWGEALIGYVGLSFASWLVVIGSLLWLGAAILASSVLHNVWIMIFAGVGWLLALMAWSYLISVASQVYKSALYLYAAEGFIAAPYNQEMLDAAWKRKTD